MTADDIEGATDQLRKDENTVQDESAQYTVSVLVHPPKESPANNAILLASISSSEIVAGIRHLLSESPEVCYYTAYKLFLLHEGNVITEMNDFSELDSYEVVKNAIITATREKDDALVEVQMETDSYTVKKARDHVKRFKEIVQFPPETVDGIVPGERATTSAARKGSTLQKTAAKSSEGQKLENSVVRSTEEAKIRETREQREEVSKLKDLAMPSACELGLSSFYDVGFGVDPSLLNGSPKSPCLKSITNAPWNPPPSSRRLFGDLIYLKVVAIDDTVLNVTCIPSGFYINNTRDDIFDPNPAPSPHHSHDLISCLLSASPSFRREWALAIAQASKRAAHANDPLHALLDMVQDGKLDSITASRQWNVPMHVHTPGIGNTPYVSDESRAEKEALNTFGMEERGPIRDWNEELQSIRLWPAPTSQLAEVRARALHRVLSDFHEAATIGAVAICEGYFQPINNVEPEKSYVYVFNNIFFSFAVDGKEGGRTVPGDPMAHKGALHDLRNVATIASFDIPELFTLGMTIIDYLGKRLVAQSVIPGILQGDTTFKLVYGSVEPSLPLKIHSEMHEKLAALAPKLIIAERTIPAILLPQENSMKDNDSKDCADTNVASTEVSICGPAEIKGLQGYDSRHYIMEIVRLTPRDANWVDGDGLGYIGTGVYTDWLKEHEEEAKKRADIEEESGGNSFADKRYALCTAVLRQEVVAQYVRGKLMNWSRERKAELVMEMVNGKMNEMKESENTVLDKETDGKTLEAQEKEKDGLDTTDDKTPSMSIVKSEEKQEDKTPTISFSEKDVANFKEEEENIFESLRMNVNVFMPYVGCVDKEQLARDEELVRQVSLYLWKLVLPSITTEVKHGTLCPKDGAQLTETLHTAGVNVRYLGRLATIAVEEEALDRESLSTGKERRWRMPLYWLELLELEMVCRAAKHYLAYLFKVNPSLITSPGPTLLLYLNCLLGKGGASPPMDEEGSGKTGAVGAQNGHKSFPKGKKGKGSIGEEVHNVVPEPPVVNKGLTHESVWTSIANEVRDRFRHKLVIFGPKNWEEKRASSLRLPLLRRACQQMGIRVLSKKYDFDLAKPFSFGDIVDVFPISKSNFPPSPYPEASSYLDHSRQQLTNGGVNLAYELAQHAAVVLQRVCNGMHTDFTAALDIQALVLHAVNNSKEATVLQARSLAFSAQLSAFDSASVTACQDKLSLYCSGSGDPASAIRHLRAFCYMLELGAGPRHPELSTAYLRMGQIFAENGQAPAAMRCIQECLLRENTDRVVQGKAHHALADLLEGVCQFKQALQQERTAYSIYQNILGEDHSLTSQSTKNLTRLATLAVDATRNQLNIEKDARLKAIAALSNMSMTMAQPSGEEKKAHEVSVSASEQSEIVTKNKKSKSKKKKN